MVLKIAVAITSNPMKTHFMRIMNVFTYACLNILFKIFRRELDIK